MGILIAMSDEPRLVSLQEHRGKSILPPLIGGINTVVAMFLLGASCIGILQVFSIFIFLPGMNTVHQEAMEERRIRIEKLEQQFQQAATDMEREAIRNQIEAEQRLPLPPAFPSISGELQSATLIPFLMLSMTGFLILAFLLLLASGMFIFRLRWSRTLFLILCWGHVVLIALVMILMHFHYSSILVDRFIHSGVGWIQEAGEDAEFLSLLGHIYQRNLTLALWIFGLMAMLYFFLMIYLAMRLEVREDLDRKPAQDLMDWDHLSEHSASIRRLS